MSPAERLSTLVDNIRACDTALLRDLKAGYLRIATPPCLEIANLMEEELTTRRELEALCVPQNMVHQVADALSMSITEVLMRWRRLRIAQARA